MTSAELENLVSIGQLKRGEASKRELDTLLHSGGARLKDAENEGLAIESRFDLAYNAAHAFALAALRYHGYRSENRYVVFQALPHTAEIPAATWRILAKAHGERNLMEYEGGGEVDDRLLQDLISAGRQLERAVRELVK